MNHAMDIQRVSALDDAAHLRELAGLLIDCVEGGASVGFMQPLSLERALAFWHGVAADVAAGRRVLLVARKGDGRIAGTVQLVLAQPENQPHRADLVKLLVHRQARGRGLGRSLMLAAEDEARRCGRHVLVLDTAVDGGAEPLYEGLGWQRVGTVPHYALMPDGAPCATCYYYKHLATPSCF